MPSQCFFMPKRKRTGGQGGRSRKVAKRQDGSIRTYRNSRVPASSRGYVPNIFEMKVADTDGAVYQVNTTGSITALCVPTVGSDMTNRVGRKILLRSVYIRGYVSTEASAAAVKTNIQSISQLARCLIVWDTQPNGSNPVITDVLKEATSYSQLNLNNRDRFKILWDKTWAFGPYVVDTTASSAIALTTQQSFPFKKFKKLSHEAVFNATNGGTVADINTGNLIMIWVGNVAAGSNLDSNARCSVRVRFDDK